MNNRPDLLSEATLVRAFKIYLEQIKAPQVTLSAPTTSMVVDPSVRLDLLRSSKSGLLLLLPSSEMSHSIRRLTKLSLRLKKNCMILFVVPENTPQLAHTIWTQLKARSSILPKTPKTSSLCH